MLREIICHSISLDLIFLFLKKMPNLVPAHLFAIRGSRKRGEIFFFSNLLWGQGLKMPLSHGWYYWQGRLGRLGKVDFLFWFFGFQNGSHEIMHIVVLSIVRFPIMVNCLISTIAMMILLFNLQCENRLLSTFGFSNFGQNQTYKNGALKKNSLENSGKFLYKYL